MLLASISLARTMELSVLLTPTVVRTMLLAVMARITEPVTWMEVSTMSPLTARRRSRSSATMIRLSLNSSRSPPMVELRKPAASMVLVTSPRTFM